ncbi:tripartite tricarboxylate transporter TctB family protein [Desulfofundulus thermosubterraneus]|uniref:Tripartite tricarboxylate transporter TctB family protein n=1 Tax=Desulfofundulus thermosubterraneus DSM 16057 TaxID=1121432 RepID=A0A1M6CWI0_9FIRM|nr:tripartite tricarboxylate transporter TctB family protein [Desulfofundulus thermosubterraneus]SHI65320.1 Tripartite tricarboxylate transporter TctB family protein [Desulfofundulus thermosubterraneus DSM 16057]
MSSRKADLIAGVASIVVALLFGFQGRELSLASKVFPLVLEVFLVMMGLVLVVRGLTGCKEQHSDQEKIDYGRAWLVVVASLVYVACINYAGFYVSTFVFLTLLSWWLSDRGRNLPSLGISGLFGLLVTAALYATFWLFLKVPTPQGLLF